MAYPHLDLAAYPHSRVAERRRDDRWLEQQWADPATRVLLLAGGRLRVDGGVPVWHTPDQLADLPGTRVWLGERDGRARFALIGEDPATRGDQEWTGLRGVLSGLLTPDNSEAPLVFHAVGAAEWLAHYRHCPRCGGRLGVEQAGHELRCESCGRIEFPRTDPAVIMLIVHGDPGASDERCLLGRHPSWPTGRYSTLAGFVEPGETLEDAVRREVLEEAGVHVGRVDYFGNQPWPMPSSLMIGFIGQAVSLDIQVDQDELEDARWLTREQMREQAEAGSLVLPGGVSISRSLVEHWYGASLPGSW